MHLVYCGCFQNPPLSISRNENDLDPTNYNVGQSQVARFDVIFKVPPLSTSNYTLKIMAQDDHLAICNAQVREFGSGFPCSSVEDIPETEYTVRADGYTQESATIYIGSLTNTG